MQLLPHVYKADDPCMLLEEMFWKRLALPAVVDSVEVDRLCCYAHEQPSAALPGGDNESHPAPPARVVKRTFRPNPEATGLPPSAR